MEHINELIELTREAWRDTYVYYDGFGIKSHEYNEQLSRACALVEVLELLTEKKWYYSQTNDTMRIA